MSAIGNSEVPYRCPKLALSAHPGFPVGNAHWDDPGVLRIDPDREREGGRKRPLADIDPGLLKRLQGRREERYEQACFHCPDNRRVRLYPHRRLRCRVHYRLLRLRKHGQQSNRIYRVLLNRTLAARHMALLLEAGSGLASRRASTVLNGADRCGRFPPILVIPEIQWYFGNGRVGW
jgi:hypothetical protein